LADFLRFLGTFLAAHNGILAGTNKHSVRLRRNYEQRVKSVTSDSWTGTESLKLQASEGQASRRK
jgi:hypothetical protein